MSFEKVCCNCQVHHLDDFIGCRGDDSINASSYIVVIAREGLHRRPGHLNFASIVILLPQNINSGSKWDVPQAVMLHCCHSSNV
jgi:hypothetical protein